MKIIYTKDTPDNIADGRYHILTFAETGYAILNHFTDDFNIDRQICESFSDAINQRDEASSLYPKAPISAVPRRYIRDMEDSAALANQIVDFLKANYTVIHAKKLYIDFRACVAPFVLEAIAKALESNYASNLSEVIIVDSN